MQENWVEETGTFAYYHQQTVCCDDMADWWDVFGKQQFNKEYPQL